MYNNGARFIVAKQAVAQYHALADMRGHFAKNMKEQFLQQLIALCPSKYTCPEIEEPFHGEGLVALAPAVLWMGSEVSDHLCRNRHDAV